MTIIRAFQEDDLNDLALLVNFHISLVIPAWGLPREFIRSHLDAHPEQNIIDPWVIERKTILAFREEKLVAAAHLLRYGSEEPVGIHYHNRGDIAWFVFYADYQPEAEDLLAASLRQMQAWGVDKLGAWDSGLPIPCNVGINDKWPHLAAVFRKAGFLPNPARREAIFGGSLKAIPRIRGGMHYASHIYWEGLGRLVASVHTVPIGFCIVKADLSLDGAIPTLKDWAELCEIHVDAPWRRQKMGMGMLQIALDKLLENGCKNMVFNVAIADEEAGAGDFYRAMGFDVLARCEDAWELPMPQAQ